MRTPSNTCLDAFVEAQGLGSLATYVLAGFEAAELDPEWVPVHPCGRCARRHALSIRRLPLARRRITILSRTQSSDMIGYLVLAPLSIHLFEQRPLLQLASELCSLGRIQLPQGEHKRLPVRRDELDSTGLLPQLPLYG